MNTNPLGGNLTIREHFPSKLQELIFSGGWSELGPPLLLTRQMIDDFARLSGDRNPIHIDEVVAQERGHKTVVAHGMLLASLLPRLDPLNIPLVVDSGLNIVDRNPSPDFCAYVPAGTWLQLKNRVLSYKEKLGAGFLKLEYHLFGADQKDPVMKFTRTLVCTRL